MVACLFLRTYTSVRIVYRFMKKFFAGRYFFLALGLVVGALIILLIRFATYKIQATHYHANFAVYINGQREQFKGPGYYQEETACVQGDKMTPVDRAHMHDSINNVVHVHDHAATWEQFFNNLGWSIGINYIQTRDAIYQDEGNSVLHVLLNGQDLTGISQITNRVIGDRDKLLISYGDISTDQLEKEYKAIPNTAIKHDEEKDPATCSGPSVTTFHDRITHLF